MENSELWKRAEQNTVLRARASELSRQYAYLLRAIREIGQLEDESGKGPQAALHAMAECVPAFSKRMGDLDAWIVKAEAEYEQIMAALDYQNVR